MFKYVKHLAYPISVTKKDLKMAKLIITQVGGYAGELGATLRYFHQKFTMPDEKGSFYTEHGKGVFPMSADGVAFDASTFAVTGNPLADLVEDMAAEQKARVAYEHLIDLATDPKVIEPLLFLRQREVVHFNRFEELYNYYKEKGYK